ncbi:MAG: hypothetical protein AAFO98_06260 [Pseudomonadota bacterium]
MCRLRRKTPVPAIAPFPVILFCCNRPGYLRRSLDALLARDDEESRRIIVSQDGRDPAVAAVIAGYGTRVEHWHFDTIVPSPRRRYGLFGPRDKERMNPAWRTGARIAQHYKFALDRLLISEPNEAVIVLEDDLEIACDFFSLMRAGGQLMREDPTIWSVSAFNDHGYGHFVDDPSRLNRTEFFPGLGWLATRAFWQDLPSVWAESWWDDWLRQPKHRKGRSVIAPEISRVRNFGVNGSTSGFTFDRYLADLVMNETPIDFELEDLSYLEPQTYDAELRARVLSAVERQVETLSDIRGQRDPTNVRLLYHGISHFDLLANVFGIWPYRDSARCPRNSYRGVVELKDQGRSVFLVPAEYVS